MFDDEDEDAAGVAGVVEQMLGISAADDEESLMGAIKKAGAQPTPQVKAAMRNFAAKKVKTAVSSNVLSKAQKVAVSKFSELDSDTKTAISQRRVQFIDSVFMLRVKVTGTAELLTSSAKEQYGISSWNGKTLPVGTNLTMEGVSLAYGTGAAASTPVSVKYTQDGNAVDAYFLNGLLQIEIDTKPVLKMPVSRFMSDPKSAMSSIASRLGFLRLDAPKLIKSNVPVDIKFIAPEGASFPAGTDLHFFEICLFGPVTAARTTA